MSARVLLLSLCTLFISGILLAPGITWVRSGNAEEIVRSSRRPALAESDPRCAPIERSLSQHKKLDFDEFNWTSAASDSLVKSLTENPVICLSDSSFSSQLRPLADRICPLVRELSPRSSGIQELRARLHQQFAILDAASFLSHHPQWRLARPCESDSNPTAIDGILASIRHQRCPAYWSSARCARVLHLLETQSPESWGF